MTILAGFHEEVARILDEAGVPSVLVREWLLRTYAIDSWPQHSCWVIADDLMERACEALCSNGFLVYPRLPEDKIFLGGRWRESSYPVKIPTLPRFVEAMFQITLRNIRKLSNRLLSVWTADLNSIAGYPAYCRKMGVENTLLPNCDDIKPPARRYMELCIEEDLKGPPRYRELSAGEMFTDPCKVYVEMIARTKADC
ncbi:hypothetical protein BO70DRAFT_351064 [Aspergillus heteromorphus CBS 117.55]|uniref:Uncharacterized protein n=1 Tax=Aspergillus heteromorphus CBS 117.55 TaxID=1448321 RepID=A0A317WM42_9EURO|nr:uncharacterized protein BO70DRAFT_351064 [Aspergillus heteromorphus CBS 117.55]PWY87566.1 hypothetical protein BO70DRAFT_351064 [Aspergillus heteromorphus CBS 117.55]